MAAKNKDTTDKSRRVTWLVVLGAILLPIAGIIWWINVDLLNTDNYVSLIAPVASDPAVQTSLANYLTETIFSRVDTITLIQDALPKQNPTVAQILNDALINFSSKQIMTALQSDRFEQIWVTANQALHQQITKLLLGEGQVLTLQNGSVAVDLTGILDQIKTGLTNKGLVNLAAKIPQQNYAYPLIEAPRLARLEPFIRTVTVLFPWLPLAVIALFGAAIRYSDDRMSTIALVGRALLIVAAVMSLLILVVRSQYLSQPYTEYFTRDVAAVVFDAITRPLWFQVLVLSVLVIFGVTIRRSPIITKKS